MKSAELKEWFRSNGRMLEAAYLKGVQPWQQSGFGLHTPRTYEMWEAQRRPIADCIESSGTFFDVGCANGYLLECVMRWTGERGVSITPYGLDLSEKLCRLARGRLSQYGGNIFVGNAWDWTPPREFRYVRTELEYVPLELHSSFVQRLLDLFIEPGGCLLVAEYRGGRADIRPELTIDSSLERLGFSVADVKSGYRDEVEQTRVAVIEKEDA